MGQGVGQLVGQVYLIQFSGFIRAAGTGQSLPKPQELEGQPGNSECSFSWCAPTVRGFEGFGVLGFGGFGVFCFVLLVFYWCFVGVLGFWCWCFGV